MATSKKRINISLPAETEAALERLAERDNMPQATKAIQLIHLAIEIDEDDIWNKLASKRDTTSAKFISHKKAWA